MDLRSKQEIALFVNNQITTMLSYWSKDLTCHYSNDAYLNWLGKNREDMRIMRLDELMGDDLKSMNHIYRVLQGEKLVFEQKISPLGTIRYIVVTYYPDFKDNEVIGFIVHIDDITKLKEKEQELIQTYTEIEVKSNQIENILENHSMDINEKNKLEKENAESAQRFTAIVQNGSDLIFIIDQNHQNTYVSPSVHNLLDYDPEFLLNKPATDFFYSEDFLKLIKLVNSSSTQKVIELPSIRIRHSNGSWKWMEATVDKLFENPAIKGMVLNAKDITERKKEEAEKELMIKELTRSNNDLKQFSFITSHNLRAPLSNITGLLAVLELDHIDEANREILELVDIAARQLTNTINDITEIMVIKNTVDIQMCAIDIEKVFNKVNKNFINTQNDVAAQITLDFEVAEIYFNITYLESIFINLISNAIKYRLHGATLKIKVATYRNEEDRVILLFSDNGMGVDLVRHKDRIFGMYQRFHSHTEGVGLGLFIVKSQIEAMGGEIMVESEINNGTTFKITFPL